MKLVKTVGTVFVVRVLSAVLQASGLVFFARELGATLLGVYVLFETLLQMFNFAANLGIDKALEKRVSEGKGGHFVASAILMKGIILTVLLLVVVAGRGYLNDYMGGTLALLLVPALGAYQAGRVVTMTLRGEKRVDEAAVLQFVRRALFVGVGGALIVMGYGPRGLVYGLIVSWVVFSLLGFVRSDTSVGTPTREAARSLFDFSKYNFIAVVVGGYMYNWMDTLMIGVFLPQSHVAAYEIAWRITGMVMMLSSAIARTIFPQVSDWDVDGQRDRIAEIIPDAVTGSLLLVFPAVVGVALFRAELFRYLFGAEYAIAALALLILMVSKIPHGINNVLGQVLLGVDKPNLVARAVSMFIVLNFVLNVTLIPAVGLVGAALATGLSFTVNTFLTGYYLHDVLPVRFAKRDLSVLTLAALGMGAVLVVARRVVAVDSVVTLLAVVAVGVLVYPCLLLLSESFRSKVRRAARSIVS